MIMNYPFVHLGSKPINTKILSIISVGKLYIEANILGTIREKLTIQDVSLFEANEGAWNHLVTDEITFRNANFSERSQDHLLVKFGQDFRPRAVDKKLEVVGCSMKNTTVDLTAQVSRLDSVVFRNCRISNLKMNLRTINFEMSSNYFDQMSTPQSMKVDYLSSFTLYNNSYKEYPLPNINSSSKGFIDLEDNLNCTGKWSKEWLNSFKFE